MRDSQELNDNQKLNLKRDLPNPGSVDKDVDLDEWNEDQARRTAEQDGIELTEDHWDVVYCLRDYYVKKGIPETGREVGDMLDEQFKEQGGRKHLRRLFPEGPVAQGMRIAGLPIPPHTVDDGFGTSR